ncbi:S26 family signal peptidase [Candidatus Microgenomates bacterium]|nr:S26 family signal peptidase [Candidatus Microgenomates bacterium]
MKPPISKFKVYGNSMLPTLKQGQEVLTFNWGKAKVGDVVVIKHDGKEMVKRVTKINDPASPRLCRASRQILVEVEGDNKKESIDSRHFGAIFREQIMGKVIYK